MYLTHEICYLSGSCEFYQWKLIRQSADMGRRCVAPYPTRSTRPHEHSHCRAKPTRTVRVHCEHFLMWSQCTGRTRRSGPVPSNGRVVRPTVHATDYNQTFHGGWVLAIVNIFIVVIIRTQKHTDRQTVENTVWIALYTVTMYL